ncbi:MAG: hypothetical protein PVI30_02210 [Myxococcales bacterium]|jgi:hypothetical protein
MTSPLIPEEVDLAELTGRVAELCGSAIPHGYVRGKTVMRDAAVSTLGCSEYEAELLVDQLERRGFARFEDTGEGPGGGRGTWHLSTEPPSVR